MQWRECVVMMLMNPVLGVGPGESAYVMRDYGGIQVCGSQHIAQVLRKQGYRPGYSFFLFACFHLGCHEEIEDRRDSVHDPAWSIYKYLRLPCWFGHVPSSKQGPVCDTLCPYCIAGCP